MLVRVVAFACLLQTVVCPPVQEDEHYFCPTPVAPPHGTVIGTDYEMGSYIIIKCDPGYIRTGMMQIYCVGLPNPWKKMAGWDNVVGQNPECHPMTESKQQKRDDISNESANKILTRKSRSPEFLVDMGEPKTVKDDFADLFEQEPQQEAVLAINTKVMYANELKKRKNNKKGDFAITPLKYKSHKFHDKNGQAACSLEKLTGPCRSRKIRYFYNISTEQCEQFIYGGCRGNGNNFMTMEDCENACRK